MTRRVLLVAVLASAAAGVLARAQTPAAAVAPDFVAGSDADELTGSATYSNFRRFTVNIDAALRQPPLA